jgi:hypothetical protein
VKAATFVVLAALAAASCCTPETAEAGPAPAALPQQPARQLDPTALWKGPPVKATLAADGSLAVVMTAPTASHDLELADVVVSGDTATVRLLHTSPGNAPVAQVVTEVVLDVPAARIPATVRTVHVEVRTRRRDDPTQGATPAARAATAARG